MLKIISFLLFAEATSNFSTRKQPASTIEIWYYKIPNGQVKKLTPVNIYMHYGSILYGPLRKMYSGPVSGKRVKTFWTMSQHCIVQIDCALPVPIQTNILLNVQKNHSKVMVNLFKEKIALNYGGNKSTVASLQKTIMACGVKHGPNSMICG